jgi:hypothetical protein
LGVTGRRSDECLAARREMKMDKKPRAASDAFRDSRLPEKSRRGR